MAQSTAKTLFKYKAETTAGTFPTASYTELGDVTDLPEIFNEVNALDCTPLNTDAHEYCEGLRDSGGDWSFKMNITQANVDAWNNLCDAAKTASASGKATWFEIHPDGFTKSVFFKGIPQKIGWVGAAVDEVFNGAVHIIPTGYKGWEAKSN